MKDEIKRFRERRDARIKEKRADEEWITMHGTHVLIDDEGQVSKGPETLKSVVKSGGGYKSRAERKYGSNEKYAKALGNGWNQRNKPDTNKPSAGKYVNFLDEHGFGKEEKKTSAEEAREKMVKRAEPPTPHVPKNQRKFDRATSELADIGDDYEASKYIAKAMDDKAGFSKKDIGKLADGYCEHQDYDQNETKSFKEEVKKRHEEIVEEREERTEACLGRVPDYEDDRELVADMKREVKHGPLNEASVKKVVDSYCEYTGTGRAGRKRLLERIGF